jgi:16S rRNA (uracil1498-N3)-methyltransferase
VSERFFLTDAPVSGRAKLSGDEARHLARVLRAKVGDPVSVFDGSGRAWPAHVVAIGRHEVELATGDPVDERPQRGARLTLAVALPKGERQKWLVEKLTELGVDRLVPLITERGVAEATPSAIERLERGVIEACKQCGRNRLMEIGKPATVAAVVASMPAGTMGIIADPNGAPLDLTTREATTEIVALVGPEGGFTDAERATPLNCGFHGVTLAPHILRIETAAIALAAKFAGCSSP